jgi:hypothetical protein
MMPLKEGEHVLKSYPGIHVEELRKTRNYFMIIDFLSRVN